MGESRSEPTRWSGDRGGSLPLGPLAALDDVTMLTPSGWVAGSVRISGDTIESVEASPRSETLAGQVLVVPGLIDLQVNGGWGIDLAQSPERLWELGTHLLSVGVTSWLPTLVTSAAPVYQRALDAIADPPSTRGPGDTWVGATPLGWHFEGPWISSDRAGAHRSMHIQPVPESVPVRFDRSSGLRMVTLAPELPGACRAIGDLVARDVTVSLGHSNASATESHAGVAAGATMGTHLFNAMTGLHHRTPGLAAALLTSDAYVGLIADGLHVDDEMVRLAWRMAEERLVLVSDSMAGLGLDRDDAQLGSKRVVLDGTSARLADGTLAGSVISLRDAVRQLSAVTGCSLAQASTAAAATPAAAIGEARRGSVVAGMVADLTVFDEELNVLATVVSGHVGYAS